MTTFVALSVSFLLYFCVGFTVYGLTKMLVKKIKSMRKENIDECSSE